MNNNTNYDPFKIPDYDDPERLTIFYSKDGKQLRAKEFHDYERRMIEFDPHYNRLALDDLSDCEVSTIFLFCDHNYRRFFDQGEPDYKPILWETMIFPKEVDPDAELFMERYSDKDIALFRHNEIVAELISAGSLKDWLDTQKNDEDANEEL